MNESSFLMPKNKQTAPKIKVVPRGSTLVFHVQKSKEEIPNYYNMAKYSMYNKHSISNACTITDERNTSLEI